MDILTTTLSTYWWAIPLLIVSTYLKTPSGKGLLGETVVNLCGRFMLDGEKYRLVRNVTLPTADGTTQVDHVILSRYGVFVIETKNYGGWIFGSPRQKMWTQKFPRSSHSFQNPLHQNFKHVRTLATLLQLDDCAFHSLIVFVGPCTFKTEMPENVTTVGGYIRFIKSKQTVMFSTEQVADIERRLEASRLTRSLRTNREHVRHVRELVERKRTTSPTAVAPSPDAASATRACPQCGGDLLELTIKTGARAGEKFVGCSAFPSCRFVQPNTKVPS